MTNDGESAGGITAAELMAKLAADREYQRKKQAFDQDLADRKAAWLLAQLPLLAELRSVGVEVESVWDLVQREEPYPSALPVLFRYLEAGDLPDRVLEGVGRAMAVKPSITYWDQLVNVLKSASSEGQKEGAAVALAACATPAKVPNLIEILNETERIGQHMYLVRPILSEGGLVGRAFVETLLSDDVLSTEAGALLQGRQPST